MAAFIDRALGLITRPGETTPKGVPGSRVAMLDDDLSFVGTSGNALLLQGPNDNVVGGFSANSADASAFSATIAGGGSVATPNRVSAGFSAVAGGSGNTASGAYSTVAGGRTNTAAGLESFAAGTRARAIHKDSFVWHGGSWTGGDTYAYSQGDYSFKAHATGGVYLYTNAIGAATGCSIAPASGSWACTSDRNVKENFRAVDGRQVLERVAKLPISSWNYKGQNDRFRHIGPTSQDFKAAFAVGEDDRTIAMVDADGISLAAIQALYRENLRLRRDNAAQDARIEALERAIATP